MRSRLIVVLVCACLLTLSLSAVAGNPAPTLSSVSPNAGSVNGGTTVTLAGTNFLAGASVVFGSAAANNVVVVSSTTVTATTPPNSAGPVQVTVTNPDGQSATLVVYVTPLTNAGFELGKTGWIWNNSGSAAVISNSSLAHTGSNFLQLTSQPSNHPTYGAILGSGSSQYLAVNPGDVITFGGWIERVSGDGFARWSIQVTDSNKANPTYASTANSTSSSWTFLQQTYTVPAGKAFIRFYAEIYNNTLQAQANFDDAILQQQSAVAAFTYDPPPSITSISPASGSALGGTALTINGSNFIAGATVTLGGIAATSVNVVNGGTITASSPADTAGTVDVSVTNPDGDVSTLPGGYTYVSYAAPILTSVSPAVGPTNGGTMVTLSGANFLSGATVNFGNAAALNVVVVNSNTITATTPAGLGAVNVTVTNPDGQNTGIQPLINPGFESGSTAWMAVGAGSASVLTSSSAAHSGNNYAQIAVPPPATQESYFALLNGSSEYLPVNAGDVIKFGGWSYRVDSNTGDGLARWLIEVTDSNKANPSYFAANPTNVTTASWVLQQNSYAVPQGKSNVRFMCQITGTAGNSQAVANFDDAFLVQTPASNTFTYQVYPTLGWIGPNSGPANSTNQVTISGSNFVTGATVAFGGVAATNVNVVSSKTITATTPAGSAGTVAVAVTNPSGATSTPTLTYTFNPPPTISSVSPALGPLVGGGSVTVGGANFLPGAKLTLGGTPALNITTSSTSISATAPAHAAGQVDVVVTNPDGQSVTASGAYSYQQPAPSITAINPPSGTTNGGTLVVITGANFLPSPVVTFGSASATVTAASSTSITVTSPPASSTGAVSVTVFNSDGQSNGLPGGFNYVSPGPTPSITSLSSSSGPTAGGASITINGANFISGATVAFGGVSATNVSVASGSTITASTPPHAPGRVNVTVTNPDGQTATLLGTIPLLPNPGFESGTTDWQFVGSGSASVVADPAGAEDGNQYAVLTSNAGASASYYATDTSGSNEYFPVVAGDVISFGGWAYRLAGDGQANFTLVVANSSKSTITTLRTAPGNATTPIWANMLGSYTVPANAAFVRMSAQIRSNTVTARVRFDGSVLQRMPAGAGYTYVGLNSPGVFTYHYDNMRTGQNTNETTLTPANVNSTQFGKKFSYPVDGWIHAQPLYVANVSINGSTHNVVYVATEHDSVYAFDADGAQSTPLWQASFINPGAGITTIPTGDIGDRLVNQPEFGVMATPVIDPVAGTIYVIARTKENGAYALRLHALDITNGAERPNSPVLVQVTIAGTGIDSVGGQVSYNAFRQNVRPALALSNGVVYFGAASLEDLTPYHGWVFGYDATSLNLVGVFNTTPNGTQGGIWQAGDGIGVDAAGNLYFQTGNGTFDANLGGADFGDSIVKLQLSSTGLNVVDSFTPYNQAVLNQQDWDLASGGILLLPDQPGPHVHEMIGGGKQGTLYVLDRDAMGGFNASGDTQIVQALPAALTPTSGPNDAGLWSTPTYWNNLVYIAGRADVLKVFALQNGQLTGPIFKGALTMFIVGEAVTSNGNSNPILWVTQGDPANILRAYDAYDVSREYYDSNQVSSRDAPGGITRFSVPVVVNGKVYVGTKTELDVYGLF